MLILFPPRRESPDRILKKKAAHAPQSDEIIKSLPQVHHILVDILASMCWIGILQDQPGVLFVALETHNHQKFIERSMLKVLTLSNVSSVTRRGHAQHPCQRALSWESYPSELPVRCNYH